MIFVFRRCSHWTTAPGLVFKIFYSEFISRVEDATGNIMEAQNELQTQKRRNVLLEKQLGKARVEQGVASSKPG